MHVVGSLIHFRSIFLAFSVILIVSCNKTTGSQHTQERQRLAQMHAQVAFDFMFNENHNVAQGEAEEALRLDPRGVAANHAMARVQQLVGEHEKTVHFYRQALRSDPFDIYVLNDYAQYLCQRGEIDQALELFDLAGKQMMQSQRMVSYTRAAACSIKAQHYQRAEQYLLRALQLDAQSQPILLNLVRASINQTDYSKAKVYMSMYQKVTSNLSGDALSLNQQIIDNL